MDQEFLNIQELSRYLNMKQSTLYAMVRAGSLPHYRIGRLIRVKKEEIDVWMNKNKKDISSESLQAKDFFNDQRSSPKAIDRVIRKAIDETKGLAV